MFLLRYLFMHLGFPHGASGKESTCQCSSHGFDPWVRKIPWRKKWQPTPVFLGNPMDRGVWQTTIHGVAKESDMTQHLNKNNNNDKQISCCQTTTFHQQKSPLISVTEGVRNEMTLADLIIQSSLRTLQNCQILSPKSNLTDYLFLLHSSLMTLTFQIDNITLLFPFH